MSVVLNKRFDVVPEGAVYVGRPTKWGNPYVVGVHGDRDHVVGAYRKHLWDQILNEDITIDDLLQLVDKQLVCYCAPLPCHAQVLAAAALWAHDHVIWEANFEHGPVLQDEMPHLYPDIPF